MDKKSTIRSGLFFGITMTVFFVLRNLLERNNPTAKDVMIIIVSGVIGGAISGFLFGWIMGLFANSKMVTQATNIDLTPGETIVFTTGANHFKGAEAVGGRLYLTNQRLVFKSHKLNIQNHLLSLHLSEVRSIKRYKTLGLVNNGLAATTTSGTIEKFVVQQPEEWVRRLSGKME